MQIYRKILEILDNIKKTHGMGDTLYRRGGGGRKGSAYLSVNKTLSGY